MHICSEGISLGSGPPKSCQKLLDLKGLWGSFQNIPKCQTQAFLAPWLCGPDSHSESHSPGLCLTVELLMWAPLSQPWQLRTEAKGSSVQRGTGRPASRAFLW